MPVPLGDHGQDDADHGREQVGEQLDWPAHDPTLATEARRLSKLDTVGWLWRQCAMMARARIGWVIADEGAVEAS
jgi:hypothetical protein